MTGVLERPLLKRSITYLKKIVPECKRVLVLFDDGTTAKVIKEEVFKNSDNIFINGMSISIKGFSSWNDWQKFILSDSFNYYDAVILGLYHTLRSGENNNIVPEQVIKWTSQNCKIPIFGFWDFSVGKNLTTGGFVLSGKAQGYEAGKIIKLILEKKKSPSDIFPVTATKGQFIFSRYMLKKYKLTIPQGIRKKSVLVE